MKIKEESGIKLLWKALWMPDQEETMEKMINESDLSESAKNDLKKAYQSCDEVHVADVKKGRQAGKINQKLKPAVDFKVEISNAEKIDKEIVD